MKPVLKKRVTQKALLEPLQNIIERQEAEIFCLKSVIDNFPGSVYWKDEKGVYLGRNQYSVEKMQSLQLEPVDEKYDVTGKTDYDLFPKTVADCYRKHDQEVMKSREELTVEEPMILPNGKTIVQLSTKQPLFNENGGVIGIIGNTVDITHIKKMEAQLKKAREKQAKAQRALIDCAARVSHDIQSPLAALNTVLRNVPVMPEEQRILIRNAVRRINDIANNLLSEYRDEIKNIETVAPESSNQKVNFLKPEMLFCLLDTLLSEKKAQAVDRHITFNLDIEEAAFKIFVCVDPISLKRALSNLLNNAIDAIGANGTITVSLAGSLSDQVSIRINDNGKGMSPDLLDKVKKGGVTYGKKRGNGIGIAETIECIRESDGHFELDSKLNQGTAATIYLPVASPPDWFQENIILTPGMTVVVLDDDESIHAIWRSLCQPFSGNITLKHFYHSKDFRQYYVLADLSNTLFLIDYELLGSKESGLDIIESLNLNDKAILVTSHYEKNDIRMRAEQSGVKIIPKNYSPYISVVLTGHKQSQLILIDDDEILTTAWEHAAEIQGMQIMTFNRIIDFKEILPALKTSMPIYIDYNLSESNNGVEFAKVLHEQGFTELYLTTGYPKNHFGDLPWIKGFVSKDPPFLR